MSREFDPRDPHLTAYVLGELNGDESAAIEALMETSSEARRAVDEIRELVGRLEAELATEALPERSVTMTPLLAAASVPTPSVAPAPSVPVSSHGRSFAAVLLAAGTLIAACVLVVVLAKPPRDETVAVRFGDHGNDTNKADLFGTRLTEEAPAKIASEASDAMGLSVVVTDGNARHVTLSDTDSLKSVEKFGITTYFSALNSRPQGLARRSETVVQRQRYNGMWGLYESETRLRGSQPADDKGGQLFGRLEREVKLVAALGDRVARDFDGLSGDVYHPIIENGFLTPFAEPLSTLSVDVDTASYSNVRQHVTHGHLPPPNAVRIEEMLNYFSYAYPEPKGDDPFSATLEAGPCPWNTESRLVRIGLKGREIPHDQRPPSNLVFLLDVSGSMRDENKLPLVQHGMTLLANQMTEDDRIAIVTYAGNAGLRLDATSGDDRGTILTTIDGLAAGGSTNGAAGIHLAYEKAVANYVENGTNRVVLCTDGDFNVGVSDDDELVEIIRDKAETGVFLSVFGFGMGNLKDSKLEQLADKGNGQYGYVDDQREARKVFVEEMAGTLYTIAKDVKLQVEFNPARVGAYRLIGYENRLLAAEDFNDDTKDAGEIGAGHTVTALYEVFPPGALGKKSVDPLRYQKPEAIPGAKLKDELLTLKLRFKQPDGEKSVKREFPLLDDGHDRMPSVDFEWATAVAAYGLVLRNSRYKGTADLELVAELAAGAKGEDPHGHRADFVTLVEATRKLEK